MHLGIYFFTRDEYDTKSNEGSEKSLLISMCAKIRNLKKNLRGISSCEKCRLYTRIIIANNFGRFHMLNNLFNF